MISYFFQLHPVPVYDQCGITGAVGFKRALPLHREEEEEEEEQPDQTENEIEAPPSTSSVRVAWRKKRKKRKKQRLPRVSQLADEFCGGDEDLSTACQLITAATMTNRISRGYEAGNLQGGNEINAQFSSQVIYEVVICSDTCH